MSEVRGPNSPIAGLSAGVVHLFGPMLSMAMLGSLWLAKLKQRWLIAAVALAGRMALTNYICQSLLVAAFAQHWGMATFGEVSRVGMVVIVTSIYAFHFVFSTIWLRFFTMGPLEYSGEPRRISGFPSSAFRARSRSANLVVCPRLFVSQSRSLRSTPLSPTPTRPSSSAADIVELHRQLLPRLQRGDSEDQLRLNELKRLIAECPLPVILTAEAHRGRRLRRRRGRPRQPA